MVIKQGIIIVLSLIVVVGVLAACAGPASTPALTPTGSLAEVIAGAKNEGTVSVKLAPSTLTPKSIERLKGEIKEKFGVDLDIKFTPTTDMMKDLSEAIMEYKAAAVPSYDLMTFFDQPLALGNQAGIFEQVDFKPLITQDTNSDVVLTNPLLRGAIIHYTSFAGIMYNPEKVPPAEVPKTISDLANPKWKGKVAILNTASIWVRRAFIVGKEKTYSDIRAIVKNQAIQGVYADELNRYLLGEVWMCLIVASYSNIARQRGMPAAFQCVDYAEVTNFSVVLRKGTPHPNAAKLVAIYLASPAGAKFLLEEGGSGNLNYPGNFENDIRLQAKKQGIPEYSMATYPGLMEFMLSSEATQWQNEITAIMQGG